MTGTAHFVIHNKPLSATIAGAPRQLQDGAGSQKDQTLIRSLELSALPLQPPGKGEGLEIELITNGQRFNHSCLHSGTSIKPLK